MSTNRKISASAGFIVGLSMGTILLAGPWPFSPMHKANLREFKHNAAKVERFCGKERADAFRVAYDPDDDSAGPMREWVKRCETNVGLAR